MSARVKLNEARIALIAADPRVGDDLLEVADAISADVKAETSGSARLKQFGRKMVTGRTERGARAGTTWGPAVPVEFGTFQTSPLRILTTIAARHGKTKAGR